MDAEPSVLLDGTEKEKSVIYETNFTVDEDVVPSFIEYLRDHMNEIRNLEEGTIFWRAKLSIVDMEDFIEPGKRCLCSQYWARSQYKLVQYFSQHSQRLRKDLFEKFGSKYTVQRRILTIEYMEMQE